MSERAIKEAMSVSQADIATCANNLADWFGSSREIPEGHTGKSVVEKVYVASMLKKITEAYNEVEFFTQQLVEYREELF